MEWLLFYILMSIWTHGTIFGYCTAKEEFSWRSMSACFIIGFGWPILFSVIIYKIIIEFKSRNQNDRV